MKRLLKLSALFTVLTLAFTSCDLDDGYSLDKFWVSYATVEGDRHDFKLVLDDGSVLNIAASYVVIPEDVELDNKRVIANYTILDDSEKEGTKYYYVRLNAMEEILSKKPVYSTQVEQEEIGTDPIDIYEEAWFSGKYLNVNFHFWYSDPEIKHFINLWVDEENPAADEDNIYVELRHNAYKDGTNRRSFGRVSFDISDFIPEGKNSVTVHLKWTTYDGVTRSDSGVFTRKNVQTPSAALSINEKAGNIH